MRTYSILIAGLCAILALGACASAPKAKPAEGQAVQAKAQAQAQPGAVGPGDKKAPILVGPDFITPLKPAQVWSVLSSLDNWGAWNPKVTKVQAGPGLNVGTELRYGWEEREIKAVLEEVKEQERLVWKGARSGSDVLLRWEIKPLGVSTLVSLRAVLKPGAGQTPIANAGLETNAWIGALQIELNRLADEAKKAVK
jgi:hypothetical protein